MGAGSCPGLFASGRNHLSAGGVHRLWRPDFAAASACLRWSR